MLVRGVPGCEARSLHAGRLTRSEKKEGRELVRLVVGLVLAEVCRAGREGVPARFFRGWGAPCGSRGSACAP